MKASKLVRAIAAMVAIFVMLTSCRPESNVEPKQQNAPDIAALGDTVHTLPTPICTTVAGGSLVDAQGRLGSGNIFGADIYGIWELFTTPNEMVIQLTLNRGWFVSAYNIYYGDSTQIPINPSTGGGDAENYPAQSIVNPVKNIFEVRWPIPQAAICPNQVWLSARFTLVELDFLGLPFNPTNVWLSGSNIGGTGSTYMSYCSYPCGGIGPEIDTVTAGSCTQCDSENSVVFVECDSIYVTSCKDLSNVVIGLDDCSTIKFDNLSSRSGSWVAPAGRSIIKVWVKSGCNGSGDGPGFGRAFNNPNSCAQNYSCAGSWIISGNSGNGNGNGNGNAGGNGNGNGNGNNGGGNGNGNGNGNGRNR